MNIPLSPYAPESLASRDGFGNPVPHQPAHLHTQDESAVAFLRIRNIFDNLALRRVRIRDTAVAVRFGTAKIGLASPTET